MNTVFSFEIANGNADRIHDRRYVKRKLWFLNKWIGIKYEEIATTFYFSVLHKINYIFLEQRRKIIWKKIFSSDFSGGGATKKIPLPY